jgi:PAS domain S-box-containing protein
MENSLLTGMRALDLHGRITYVNPAFCQMTGWNEADLVGRTAPFPYWPEDDSEALDTLLEEELAGNTPAGGIQVRVKRRDDTLFDARLYVSPLIDAHGTQTGWMTSMTDITEPNRVREQLSASHERFTTVLEALDASISVAPLGSDELLFANKLYRLWFGTKPTATCNWWHRPVCLPARLTTNPPTVSTRLPDCPPTPFPTRKPKAPKFLSRN